MSPIATPPRRAGLAGEYDDAVEARKLRLVEWLGLRPESVVRADVTRTRSGTEVTVVTDSSAGTTKRGEVLGYSMDGLDGLLTARVLLTDDASDDLFAHLGPSPTPPLSVVLWGATPDRLSEGAKLYDADGNEVGEVGYTVRGAPWFGRGAHR